MFKVLNGTPKGSGSLCFSCSHAHVIKGTEFQQQVWCQRFYYRPEVIKFKVADCSNYQNKSQPSLGQMEQIAWEVKSRNRGPVGFGGNGNQALEIEICPPSKKDDPPEFS